MAVIYNGADRRPPPPPIDHPKPSSRLGSGPEIASFIHRGRRIMTLMETAQLLRNFGEFVGPFAVVGTLAYLAVQVGHSGKSLDENTRALEQNRKLPRADVLYRLSQRFDEIRYRSTENREIASIFVRGNEDLSDLDHVDLQIFRDRLGPFFNTHLNFHRMANEGSSLNVFPVHR
jgi:hypothetical protein